MSDMHVRKQHEPVAITVDIANQQLYVWRDGVCLYTFAISTALNGVGEHQGSGCTPRGKHSVSVKIGHNVPMNTVFIGRRPTGEIYNTALAAANPDRDWILTRILWLSGLEQGFNQGVTSDGACCDSQARYIYIHGTPDTEPMGRPLSHGCIRMRNDDMVLLFDMVEEGALVNIIAETPKH